MKNKLCIQKFIEEHADWEKLLSEKPYCITISRDVMFGHRLIMFKYSQIDSDFNVELVRECRGIILDEDTLEVISYAFDKFGNVNEPYVPTLDAKSMKSTVKIDGSIFKIVKLGNDLLMSTNGTISAFSAPVPEQVGCNFKSFGEIAVDVLTKKFGSIDEFKKHLDEGYTYVFELVSPWTRVVTPFHDSDLYLIGCRNNKTYEEIFFKDIKLADYFKTPDILDFSTIDDCLKYTSSLDWINEGFVVMDKNFNRVKVKNPAWLSVHHLCENHTMSYARAIEIVKANEIDEVLGYFPEFKAALEDVKTRYNDLIASLNESWLAYNQLDPFIIETRKDKAIWIQKNFKVPAVGFMLIDDKVESVADWAKQVPAKNLVKILGFKEQ